MSVVKPSIIPTTNAKVKSVKALRSSRFFFFPDCFPAGVLRLLFKDMLFNLPTFISKVLLLVRDFFANEDGSALLEVELSRSDEVIEEVLNVIIPKPKMKKNISKKKRRRSSLSLSLSRNALNSKNAPNIKVSLKIPDLLFSVYVAMNVKMKN